MIVDSCIFVLSILVADAAAAQFWDARALAIDPATATGPVAPALQGLSDLHHAVTTSSPASQAFFDQGLRLTYAFNHSEAIRAYKEAARLDPANAMAYWGWAYALGPNLNLPMMPEVTAQAYAAAQKAMSLRDKVSPAERDYIEALATRYANPAPENRAALDQAFADAMRTVAAKHPEDPDAATIYADALMNLSPWNYWNGMAAAGPNTAVIVDTLESVLRRHPDHIGALHLHIHAVEAVDGSRAEVSADRLLKLAPAAGHLVHMPTHIYMRVGRYADAYAANALADAADNSYVAQCNAQGIYPLFYHRHNQHFLTWAAMFQGRSQAALDAGRLISHGLEPGMIAGPFSETFQHLMSQPLYVMVRFGRWDDILQRAAAARRISASSPPSGTTPAAWPTAIPASCARPGRNSPRSRRPAPAPGMKDKLVGYAIGAGGARHRRRRARRGNRHRRRQPRARHRAAGPGGAGPGRLPVQRAAGLVLPGRATTSARRCSTTAAPRKPRPSTGRTWPATRPTATPCSGWRRRQAAQGKTAQAADTAEQLRRAWRDADVKLASSRF